MKRISTCLHHCSALLSVVSNVIFLLPYLSPVKHFELYEKCFTNVELFHRRIFGNTIYDACVFNAS